MTILKFELAPYVFEFECGSEYPSNDTSRLMQVHDRTAGGSLKVEELGVKVKTRKIVFSKMPKSDYDKLVNWYENIAVGAMNPFEYTDEYGIVATVRIVSPELTFDEVFLDTFSGVLLLEYA